MIGNELNVEYIDQIQFVMSLVNGIFATRAFYTLIFLIADLIQITRSRGIKIPLTLPLSADSSFEVLVDTYYDMIDLDFWSVQVYDLQRLDQVVSVNELCCD